MLIFIIYKKQKQTNMKRSNTIRLTESALHRIVKQTVNEVLSNNPSQFNYTEPISQLENSLKSALNAIQGWKGEFPEEAISDARESDGIDLYNDWNCIYSDIYESLELLDGIKYYLDM